MKIDSFRRWLADRVLQTTWASRPIPDSKIDEVAKRIGLDPEFLLEVRAEAKINKQALGFATAWHKGTSETRRYYQYYLFMPEVVQKAWAEECDFRQVGSALLLRSLIHDYLMGARDPSPLRKWHWRGKFYKMGRNRVRHHFLERAAIPLGARRALVWRATRIGSTPTAVVRALVIEALSGLHRDVPLVETGMMFDDEERYLARFNGRLDQR